MVQHREQVASALQRAVQTVLTRGLSDPRIKGMITVTGVKVSPDYAQATVMVSIHPQDKSDVTMKGLIAAAGHVRSEVSRQVQMRRMPVLNFKLDTSLKKQAEVLAALDEIERDRETGGEPTGGPEESDEQGKV